LVKQEKNIWGMKIRKEQKKQKGQKGSTKHLEKYGSKNSISRREGTCVRLRSMPFQFKEEVKRGRKERIRRHEKRGLAPKVKFLRK